MPNDPTPNPTAPVGSTESDAQEATPPRTSSPSAAYQGQSEMFNNNIDALAQQLGVRQVRQPINQEEIQRLTQSLSGFQGQVWDNQQTLYLLKWQGRLQTRLLEISLYGVQGAAQEISQLFQLLDQIGSLLA